MRSFARPQLGTARTLIVPLCSPPPGMSPGEPMKLEVTLILVAWFDLKVRLVRPHPTYVPHSIVWLGTDQARSSLAFTETLNVPMPAACAADGTASSRAAAAIRNRSFMPTILAEK